MTKVLAMHQANFLPWIGYFHKMLNADVFVLLDDVKMSKNSYGNRTRIKTPTEIQWLTIPLREKGRHTYNRQPLIPNKVWATKVWLKLQCNYARAPYWDLANELLFEDRFNHALNNALTLFGFNYVMLHWATSFLGIDTHIGFQSFDHIMGNKHGIAINACRLYDCYVYLSGRGAMNYNDPQVFEDAGIELRYQQFVCPEYPQLWGEFVPNLSIVDLIFNCGPEAGDILRNA